jgi:hypothetical protein
MPNAVVLSVGLDRGMFALFMETPDGETSCLRTYSRRGQIPAQQDAILVASALQLAGIQVTFSGETLEGYEP